MKILVCMSVVPDTTTKVTFTDNNTKFNTAGVQYIINPYDEMSLTRALELTEAQGGTVTVIHVGLADSEPSVRKALAIGAHEAVRINAEASDATLVAKEIANWAADKEFDLILTGRESIDYNGGMTGGLLAAHLGLPFVNVVSKLDINGGEATAVRDIDGGKETVQVMLPFVASAQKDLTEPRIPNMRGIMAARSKPLTVVDPGGASAKGQHQSYEMPPAKGAVQLIEPDNAAELISILHNEAKVI
ncbi:MAG: electron transfer flavoprotein beta subunit/FixA family protein [Bacteroidetes bacterium]|nr:electron transfer flavoprotein beta subunit/FixA family protein [Bacteroidota bacterium]